MRGSGGAGGEGGGGVRCCSVPGKRQESLKATSNNTDFGHAGSGGWAA